MQGKISGSGGEPIRELSQDWLGEELEKRSSTSVNNFVDCGWCGAVTRIVWVHGHGQCLACGQNILPCCEGA